MTPNQSAADDRVRDKRLRLAIEHAGVGTWDLDLLTKELSWSERTRALFNLTNEQEVDYGLFLSLLEPEDRELTAEAIDHSHATGCRFDLEYRLGSRDVLRWKHPHFCKFHCSSRGHSSSLSSASHRS